MGNNFPRVLVEQSASKMSGPTNPPRGCREGRKAAPCTLRGEEENRHRILGKLKTRENASNLPLPLLGASSTLQLDQSLSNRSQQENCTSSLEGPPFYVFDGHELWLGGSAFELLKHLKRGTGL